MNKNKNTQPLEDSKEGLHTQETFFVDYGDKPEEILIRIERTFPDGDKETFDLCGFDCDETEKAKHYAELIVKAVNERQALPELLKKIYHAIDIRCFSETENVSMTAIREELVKFGANEPDLW